MRFNVSANCPTSSFLRVVGTRRLKICFADPGRRFRDLANVTQQLPCREEHDCVADEDDQEPEKNEANPQPVQHSQLVPFGDPEIDIAFVRCADADDPEGRVETADRNIGGRLRNDSALRIALKWAFASPTPTHISSELSAAV